jgi:multidrug resistance efflux pump
MAAVETSAPLLVLLQLQRRARQAATPEALGFVAVNETLQLLPYRQAALWTEAGAGQVAALSGVPQPEPTAPYVQWLTALSRHMVRTQAAAGGVDPAQLPEALRADWAHWLPLHALWLPLAREDGPPEGGLLLAREEAFQPHELALAQELAHAYGHALAAFRPGRSLAQRALAALRTGRARRRLVIAAAVACLFPVRLTVLAEAEVVPKDPFMVRAPLDGVIDRFDVQPNQPVAAGAPLFSLDTTALRARMEVARKAVDTAQEEYRQSAQLAVTSEKNRADMAVRQGELQQKSIELAYTAEQLARVQVKSERAGIAVFADTSDWVGKAVSAGERVLLVADPSQVELVAWLPAADVLPVKPGDTLTLYPQGAPLDSFEATITTMAYRAELTRDGFVAYRLKAAFAPGRKPPRIGQLGTARLHGAWAPLAYAALRRPLAVARRWIGW